MVEVLSLKTFKIRLSVDLGSLILDVSLITTGWLDKMTFECAFQPSAICVSVLWPFVVSDLGLLRAELSQII